MLTGRATVGVGRTSATRCIWVWDAGTGLVRKGMLTPAKVYESECRCAGER